MSGHHSFGIASELNHSIDCGQVCSAVGGPEGRTGLAVIDVAEEVSVVGREHKGLRAIDADVLRREGVARSRVCANARYDLAVITRDQAKLAARVLAQELLQVVGVDPAAPAS